MSWKIGAITLPLNPGRITAKAAKQIKSIMVLTRMPLLLDFGPKTKVLMLNGHIAEEGKTAAQLETDYLIPLTDMIIKAAAFPRVLGDDDMVAGGNWSGIGWGSGSLGTATLSDSTTQVKRGTNSVRAIVGSGSFLYSGMQRTFSPAIDISKKDFAFGWFYAASACNAAIELYDGSTAQTLTQAIAATTWLRALFRLEQFTNVDLTNITRIRLGFGVTGTHYIDRNAFGVGYLVSAPDTRYDAIYALAKFDYSEIGGEVVSFTYKMELWSMDDYY